MARRRPRVRVRGRPRAGLADLARARVRFCFIARYRSRLRGAIRALPLDWWRRKILSIVSKIFRRKNF